MGKSKSELSEMLERIDVYLNLAKSKGVLEISNYVDYEIYPELIKLFNLFIDRQTEGCQIMSYILLNMIHFKIHNLDLFFELRHLLIGSVADSFVRKMTRSTENADKFSRRMIDLENQFKAIDEMFSQDQIVFKRNEDLAIKKAFIEIISIGINEANIGAFLYGNVRFSFIPVIEKKFRFKTVQLRTKLQELYEENRVQEIRTVSFECG